MAVLMKCGVMSSDLIIQVRSMYGQVTATVCRRGFQNYERVYELEDLYHAVDEFTANRWPANEAPLLSAIAAVLTAQELGYTETLMYLRPADDVERFVDTYVAIGEV